MKDGRGSRIAFDVQQKLAAWKLSGPWRKAKKTKAEAVGREDRGLDQGSDSFPLQQRWYSLPGGRIYHSRRLPLHPYRGEKQHGHRGGRDQAEKPDSCHPLGAYLQGDDLPIFIPIFLLFFISTPSAQNFTSLSIAGLFRSIAFLDLFARDFAAENLVSVSLQRTFFFLFSFFYRLNNLPIGHLVNSFRQPHWDIATDRSCFVIRLLGPRDASFSLFFLPFFCTLLQNVG